MLLTVAQIQFLRMVMKALQSLGQPCMKRIAPRP